MPQLDTLANIDYFPTWIVAYDPHHRTLEAISALYLKWVNEVLHPSYAKLKKTGRYNNYYDFRMEQSRNYPLTLGDWIKQGDINPQRRAFQAWLEDQPALGNQIHPVYKKNATYTAPTAPIGIALRKLDLTCWLEKIDPHHRDTAVVQTLYEKWLEAKIKKGYAERDLKLSALRKKTEAGAGALNLKTDLKSFLGSQLPARSDKKITYYDPMNTHTTNKATQAAANQVKFKNGYIVNQNDIPITTLGLSGKQARYAAYVVDKDGNFYIHPHIEKEHHHSSFLSGKQILCAGMIKIIDGKVRNINSNSGHYKPLNANLAAAVSILKNANVFMPDDKIIASRALNIFRLHSNGPKVSIDHRPNWARTVGHFLQQTNIPLLHSPLYWIGRFLDGIKFLEQFSITDYEIKCKKDNISLFTATAKTTEVDFSLTDRQHGLFQ